MGEKITINGVELILSDPDEISTMQWIGGEIYLSQLLAAWMIVDPKKDIPMNPQILGKPGVGKTTLAYSAAKTLNLPVYIFQCTVDTRPEDLLISPVIGENNTIHYHASALVSAMIKGGVCILDEANRMSEKSWASLAPLLDLRRYIESIIAGIKIQAHPDFRVCVTMNDDTSTFEVPEYIHSRLQPQIFIEFPERDEEFKILQFNVPYSSEELIEYTVNFLQRAHKSNKPYTVRDGINICRYYLKLERYSLSKSKNQYISNKNNVSNPEKSLNEKINYDLIQKSVRHVLNQDALDFLNNRNTKFDENPHEATHFKHFFDKLNENFFDEQNPKSSSKEDMDGFSEDDFTPDEKIEDGKEDFLDDIDADDELYYMDLDQEKRKQDDKYLDKMKTHQDDVLHIEPKKKIDTNDPFFQDEEDPNDIIRDFLKKKKEDTSHENSSSKKKSSSKSVK